MLQWGRARRRGRTQVCCKSPPAFVPASMGPRPKARKNRVETSQAVKDGTALQWGRARRRGRTDQQGWPQEQRQRFNGAAPEGAEELRGHGPDGGRPRASMGPRPKARENRLSGPLLERRVLGFNGAAPEGAEERRCTRSIRRRRCPLQWGRARRRGRTGIRRQKGGGQGALQWGRARRRGRTQRCVTQCGRGFSLQWGRARRRGRTPSGLSRLALLLALQWGRARRRGRTHVVVAMMQSLIARLQWGRARRRGRTFRYRCEAPVPAAASMGPRPKARKNRSDDWRAGAPWSRFNGAAPEGAEEHSTPRAMKRLVRRRLQWGRARRRGRTSTSRCRSRDCWCFNGAAPEGAEERGSA